MQFLPHKEESALPRLVDKLCIWNKWLLIVRLT